MPERTHNIKIAKQYAKWNEWGRGVVIFWVILLVSKLKGTFKL